MAEAHVDQRPDEIEWFAGHQPATIIGPCDHDCPRLSDSRTIAWGPDLRHYTLVECMACGCRAWLDERCMPSTPWLKPGVPDYLRLCT